MEAFYILISLFFSSLVGNTIGFGGALLLIPILSLFMDAQIAVILMGWWGIFLNVFKMYNYRDYFDKNYIKNVTIGGVPGVIIGTILLIYIEASFLKIVLASFVLIYVFIRIRKLVTDKKEKKIAQEKNVPPAALYFGGFTYGLLGGLICASGPVNVAMLESTGHQKESFIANFAAVSFPLSIVKLSIYVYKGMFPMEYLWVYIAGFFVIFLASRVAVRITPKIPKKKFQSCVMILLVIISIKLLFDTLPTLI